MNSGTLSLSYKRIGFIQEKSLLFNETFEKDLLLLATKFIEKISDPHNAKKHYQSFIRKKKTKLVKQ